MNDVDLRALVREAVARHLGDRAPQLARPGAAPVHAAQGAASTHPSHAIYLTVVNTGESCVIEPSVPCEHCGYCKSHGH
jgi:hypothetical protein